VILSLGHVVMIARVMAWKKAFFLQDLRNEEGQNQASIEILVTEKF
jgi:hypothetical protein